MPMPKEMELRRSLGVLAAAAVLAAIVLFAQEVVAPVSRPLGMRAAGVRPATPAPLGPAPVSPRITREVEHDTSEPLRRVEPIAAPRGWQPREIGTEEEEIRPLVEAAAEVRAPSTPTDPVMQAADVGPRMPSPIRSFEGISQAEQEAATGYWAVPPDTSGDIGPNHYVQAVNLSFAVYDRTGAELYGPASINTLWSGAGGPCESNNDGDPVVLYDELADRWLISQFAFSGSGPFYQCIAVSQTANPLGAWHRYTFLMHNTKMNDYPKLAVWPDGYYLSVNQFNGGQWGGARVAVFERTEMLNGNSARQIAQDLFSIDPNLGGLLPADLDGTPPPAGSPAYFAQFDDGGTPPDDGWGYPQDQLEIWAFDTDWVAETMSFTHVTDVPVASVDSNLCGYGSCVPQPGGPKLDPLSDRLMWRLQYRNQGTHETLVTAHTVDANGNDRAGVRWYELRDDGSGWAVHNQGTYSPDATQRWMGSAALTATGDLAIGYSVSSGSVEPGIRYAGRLAGDPADTLAQGEAVLIGGGGHQTHSSGRWGDYSTLSVDPVDGCTFWYTTMYYAQTSIRSWRTRIGAFRLPGCGPPPPPDMSAPTNVAVTPFGANLTLRPVAVGWTASDAESGVATFDVLLREAPWNGDFGSVATWQADTTASLAEFTGNAGTTACFSVTATDAADNTSGPSGEECIVVPVDDGDAVGNWERRSGSSRFLGTYSQADRRGRTLTLDGVQGSRIWLVADRCPSCGQIDARWNGAVVDHIDLRSRRTKKSRVFAVASFASPQTGTLEIRITTRSRPVRIDGIGIGR